MIVNYGASDLKELNRKSVFNLLQTENPISRAHIARITGISAPTVLKIIEYFIEKNIVKEVGDGKVSIGRKPKLLAFNPNAAYSIGIKYDGYHLQTGLVNLAGEIHTLINTYIEPDINVFFKTQLPKSINNLIETSKVDFKDICCVGLGLPGVIDISKKQISFAPLVGVESPFALDELLNAARIDGATEVRIFSMLILPLLLPAIASVAIVNFIPIWNDFWFPLILLKSDSVRTVPLATALLFGQFQTNYGSVFAVLTMATIPVVTTYFIFSKWFVKGLTEGGLKG